MQCTSLCKEIDVRNLLYTFNCEEFLNRLSIGRLICAYKRLCFISFIFPAPLNCSNIDAGVAKNRPDFSNDPGHVPVLNC